MQGWLYLAAIIDLCSRRVVSWSAGPNNETDLALAALEAATRQRNPEPGFIHHSDRGSVYASEDYRRCLSDFVMTRSMSRKGNCWDNAVAESFFASIKGEALGHYEFSTHAEAAGTIADYIDNFYNVSRLHSSNGYISPLEYELLLTAEIQAA